MGSDELYTGQSTGDGADDHGDFSEDDEQEDGMSDDLERIPRSGHRQLTPIERLR